MNCVEMEQIGTGGRPQDTGGPGGPSRAWMGAHLGGCLAVWGARGGGWQAAGGRELAVEAGAQGPRSHGRVSGYTTRGHLGRYDAVCDV